jgi:hypothetical protein
MDGSTVSAIVGAATNLWHGGFARTTLMTPVHCTKALVSRCQKDLETKD